MSGSLASLTCGSLWMKIIQGGLKGDRTKKAKSHKNIVSYGESEVVLPSLAPVGYPLYLMKYSYRCLLLQAAGPNFR